MNVILFELLNKIDYLTRKPLKIEIGSEMARDQYVSLHKRFPQMPEDKKLGIANLLQNYNLRDFTDLELKTLSELRLDLLFHNPNQSIDKQILRGKKLYDTGSFRVYKLLYKNNINAENIEYLRATTSFTPMTIIKNLADIYIY